MKNMKTKIVLSIVFLIGIIIGTSSYAASDIIVALDPGHGGTEPGASYGGMAEKDITWKLATRVKQILDNTSGITGVLTKTENETLGRQIRAERARDNNADLLVSFHINSNEASDRLSGAETYITCNTNQKRYYEYSYKLADNILSNLRSIGVPSFSYRPKTRPGTDPNDIYADGTVADYYGIISWPMHYDIPSVLVEHCFLNNPSDRENYLNDAMITKMAQADAQAIINNKELFRRQYEGTINTELIDIDQTTTSSGANYLNGYMYIAEWVNGECKTPDGTPEVTLKSTDGTVSATMYVGYEGGIKYYFDKNIDSLDLDKEYYIETRLTGSKNIASQAQKTKTLIIPNQTIKSNYKGRTIKAVNNKIVFSEGPYEGNIDTKLSEVKLTQNSNKEAYIAGFVDISEIVNGNSRTPKTMPRIMLKSTDGTVKENMYVGYEQGTKYYFDKMIQYIDTSKQYYIEAELTSEDNIASIDKKIQKIELGNKEIGKFGGITVIATGTNINFTYEGTINTELIDINLIRNYAGGNFISGYMYVAEWINGECRTPSTMPEITLKSTDGTVEQPMYVGYEGGIKYYFDTNLQYTDTTKEYYIEAKLTNKNNTSNDANKKQTVILPNKEIGRYNTLTVKAQNNKITIKDTSLYYGTVNTELYKMQIIQNGAGDNYISGNIYIAEWVNGECRTPSTLPQMTLKSTDGTVSQSMYVGYEQGIEYYYDKNIEKVDTTKEYYIEVKLTSNKNIENDENKKQTARITKQGQIGICTNDNQVKVSGNNIKIQEIEYYGTINTDLYRIYVMQNNAGANYICGHIYIAEWVNGECKTPKTMPQMTLKSTDGEFETIMYVGYEGGIEYYFDKNIENIDTSKEYYIEVKLTSTKNMEKEENKKQTARIARQGEIGVCTNGNTVQIIRNHILIKSAKTMSMMMKSEEPKVENKIKEEVKTEELQVENKEVKKDEIEQPKETENTEKIKDNTLVEGNVLEENQNID